MVIYDQQTSITYKLCRKALRSNFCNYYEKNCPGIYDESRHLCWWLWLVAKCSCSSKVILIHFEKVCSFTLLLKLYNIYIQMIFSVTAICSFQLLLCVSHVRRIRHTYTQNLLVKENNCQISCTKEFKVALFLLISDCPAFFCNCFAKQMLQHILLQSTNWKYWTEMHVWLPTSL